MIFNSSESHQITWGADLCESMSIMKLVCDISFRRTPIAIGDVILCSNINSRPLLNVRAYKIIEH